MQIFFYSSALFVIKAGKGDSFGLSVCASEKCGLVKKSMPRGSAPFLEARLCALGHPADGLRARLAEQQPLCQALELLFPGGSVDTGGALTGGVLEPPWFYAAALSLRQLADPALSAAYLPPPGAPPAEGGIYARTRDGGEVDASLAPDGECSSAKHSLMLHLK